MGIGLVVKNEFIKSLRNKKKLLLGFIVPVLAVLVGVGANSIMKTNITIGIIDNSNINISNNFKERAQLISGITTKDLKDKSIKTDMILGKYACVVTFNDKGSIEVTALDNSFAQGIDEIINNFMFLGDLTSLENIIIEINEESITMAERSIGFILLTFMITSTIAACSIIKDKKEGALTRFYISPRSSVEYLLGNYLYSLLSGITQIVISAIVMIILNINIGLNFLQIIIIGMAIVFISSSFAALVVSLSDTELKASAIASSFSMIIALFGGAFLPIERMPNALKFLSNGSISKWIIEFTSGLERNIGSVNLISMIVIIMMSSILLVISLMIGKRKFRISI